MKRPTVNTFKARAFSKFIQLPEEVTSEEDARKYIFENYKGKNDIGEYALVRVSGEEGTYLYAVYSEIEKFDLRLYGNTKALTITSNDGIITDHHDDVTDEDYWWVSVKNVTTHSNGGHGSKNKFDRIVGTYLERFFKKYPTAIICFT